MQVSNFIGVSKNVLSKDDCRYICELIDEKEKTSEACAGKYQFGQTGDMSRSDIQIFGWQLPEKILLDIAGLVWRELVTYASAVSSITRDLHALHISGVKIQKTPIGGGYHEWHFEQGSGRSSSRALAWMFYLNDVENGGTTEFLYQQVQEKPEAGKFVIWPAGYTHPHRGNPPYSNTKYIATGWLNYSNEDKFLNDITTKERFNGEE